MTDMHESTTEREMVLAVFDTEEAAQGALSALIERDFPMDRVSILGRLRESGDDPLGIYYTTPGERIRGWGGMGAFWGGLFGLISGAAGLFLLPGVGATIALGPIAEALVGAAAGAGIGGGLMAGGAALAGLNQAIHRMGIPEQEIERLQQRLREHHYLLMLIVDHSETEEWMTRLRLFGPDPLSRYPYYGVEEVLTEGVTNRPGDP